MANRYSVANGLASANATWDGGASVPGTGDRVLITKLSTGSNTFSTNTAGYAIGATAITLTGTVLAGSFVVGESVLFGSDPNFYNITNWNSGTKVLTVAALIIAIPASATVVTACGHVVTIADTREWGDDLTSTITINTISTNQSIWVAGTLVFSTTANSQLTANGTIELPLGGRWQQGTRATPIPSTYTSTILLNKSAALSDGKYGFNVRAGSYISVYGATKTRITTLTATANAAATTMTVTDATGWGISDEIYLANTKSVDTGHISRVNFSKTSANPYSSTCRCAFVDCTGYQRDAD